MSDLHIHPEQYDDLLQEKVSRIQAQFSEFFPPELGVYASPTSHFRARAEFRVWHEGDDCFYAMFESGQKANTESLIRVDAFPIANKAINELMPKLMARIKTNEILRARLFQCEFLSTLNGSHGEAMLVTLIYHRPLKKDGVEDAEWVAQAKALMSEFDIHIIGRSRKQKLVLSQDYVVENLNITYPNGDEQTLTYQQIEGGFTQPNPAVCQSMLSWAVGATEAIPNHADHDLLELYCGNGNFTLPLSKQFRRVFATEISKTSVNACKWNIEKNNINNITVARLSSSEFTQAYTGAREFERLKRENITLDDYKVNTIFVDPPRAGVDDETLKLVQQFEHIIYISCNPNTLHDNLSVLTQTHRIEKMALFDQFPYTHHIETGVLLSKRATP